MSDVTDRLPGHRPSAALYPFAARRLDARGLKLHYVDEGPAGGAAAPTLLLLHGNPTWSFLYRAVITSLRGVYRCVAPDLPGFGLSATPAAPLRPADHVEVIAAFADALGLDDYGLVCHDWGGPIGLAAALRRPRALRAVVIANSFAWPIRSWRLRGFSWLGGSPPAVWASLCCNAFLHIGLRIAIRGPLPSRVLAGYLGPFRQRRRRRAMPLLARELSASRQWLAALERDLAALRTTPALLCWGERDPFLRAGERRRFEQLFPRHSTLSLPAAGHFVPEDAPQAMAAAIRDWLPALDESR
jgi:haloalkane dehalogenase